MICQKTFPTSRSRPERTMEPPALRFSPTAWAKLLFLRDLGDSEVGGFGISAADDLLYIQDVQLVRQVCTAASVAFDDESVADFFDRQVDLGRKPECCGRVWVHTHPGSLAQPSPIDEETFARVFGRTDWAVMFILACQGQCYARLRFHVGPGGDLDLPVRVDYSRPFAASDQTAWQAEYLANVQIPERPLLAQPSGDPWDHDWFSDWDGLLPEEEERLHDAKEPFHAI